MSHSIKLEIVKHKIQSYLEANKVTISSLEKKAGLKPRSLYNLMYDRAFPRLDRLSSLAEALGCTVDELQSENFTIPTPQSHMKTSPLTEKIVVWDYDLALDSFKLIVDQAIKRNIKLDADRAFLLCRKVYDWSIKNKEKKANITFTEWIFDEMYKDLY